METQEGENLKKELSIVKYRKEVKGDQSCLTRWLDSATQALYFWLEGGGRHAFERSLGTEAEWGLGDHYDTIVFNIFGCKTTMPAIIAVISRSSEIPNPVHKCKRKRYKNWKYKLAKHMYYL